MDNFNEQKNPAITLFIKIQDIVSRFCHYEQIELTRKITAELMEKSLEEIGIEYLPDLADRYRNYWWQEIIGYLD